MIDAIENTRQEFTVYWIITDWCNQRCSYCPASLNQGLYSRGIMPGFPTRESMIDFAQRLVSDTAQWDLGLSVTLTGGEPTLHPDIEQIIAALGSARIEIITNAARSLTWWRSLARLPQRVVISLHPEYWSSARAEQINQLTSWLVSQGTQVHYNLVMDTARWSQVISMVEDIDPEYRAWILPKVLQQLDDHRDMRRAELTQEQQQWITDYPTRLRPRAGGPIWAVDSDGSRRPAIPAKIIAQDQHRFRGWQCSAGHRAISVDWRGRVNAGICNNQYLGSIDSWQRPPGWITCARSQCTCPGDVILSKHRPRP